MTNITCVTERCPQDFPPPEKKKIRVLELRAPIERVHEIKIAPLAVLIWLPGSPVDQNGSCNFYESPAELKKRPDSLP